MKTFSNRSNAARAARRELGGDAIPNVDFHIVPKGGKFAWAPGRPEEARAARPATPAPAAKHRKAAASKAADNFEVATKAVKRLTRRTKAEQALELMRRPEGVTGPELQDALGWQPHTVRGFISGTVRKKFGLTVETETESGSYFGNRSTCTRYRIVE